MKNYEELTKDNVISSFVLEYEDFGILYEVNWNEKYQVLTKMFSETYEIPFETAENIIFDLGLAYILLDFFEDNIEEELYKHCYNKAKKMKELMMENDNKTRWIRWL